MSTKSKNKNKKKAGGGSTKKAFDLSRDSVYIASPLELRICGGRGVLPDDEAGPLDTDPGPDVPVSDQRRLARPLKTGMTQNVYGKGVKVPIVIAKIDDVPVVIDGKSRVRAARAANRERKRNGEPLISIRCVMQRDISSRAILGVMISTNNGREDDELADRIEKLRAYLETGASKQDAAEEFCVSEATIDGWLDYDDHATSEVKRAVLAGRVPASTAAELAKIRDPDDQRAALEKMLTAPAARDRSARAARALRRGVEGVETATDRKSQRLLLGYVASKTEDLVTSHGDPRVGKIYWEAVMDTLRLVTGGKADARLIEVLTRARTGSD